jgi:hypothetical protein
LKLLCCKSMQYLCLKYLANPHGCWILGVSQGRLTYPERLEMGGKPSRMHIRDDALIEHLSRLSDPVALRFRTWLERSVALPARRMRQRAAGQAVDSF